MGTSAIPSYEPGSVAILIPAYNEECFLKTTLLCLTKENVGKIYVADDGSKDQTVEVAKSCGAEVIEAGKNLGKGGVLNLALPQIGAEYILLLDADLGETGSEGKYLLQEVFSGTDLAVAKFRSKGGFGIVRRAASVLLFLTTGRWFSAPLSGQRAARKAVWDNLMPFASGFSLEVAMLKKACLLGLSVKEVPVEMTDRSYGRGVKGIKHRFRQLLAVFRGLKGD